MKVLLALALVFSRISYAADFPVGTYKCTDTDEQGSKYEMVVSIEKTTISLAKGSKTLPYVDYTFKIIKADGTIENSLRQEGIGGLLDGQAFNSILLPSNGMSFNKINFIDGKVRSMWNAEFCEQLKK